MVVQLVTLMMTMLNLMKTEAIPEEPVNQSETYRKRSIFKITILRITAAEMVRTFTPEAMRALSMLATAFLMILIVSQIVLMILYSNQKKEKQHTSKMIFLAIVLKKIHFMFPWTGIITTQGQNPSLSKLLGIL